MMTTLSDLRLALRQWRLRPIVPSTIVLILAAGFGAATAVFAIAWAVVWRPLDVTRPDAIVWIEAQAKAGPGPSSPGAFAAFEEGARTLSQIAAVRRVSGVLSDDLGTDRLSGVQITASIFPLLGLQPAAGRAFATDEGRAGSPRVLLMTHAMWLSRYGGSASAVGQSVIFNGEPATIVGVLPASADSLIPAAQWWSPLQLSAGDRSNTGPRYLNVIGQLADGASMAAARDELRSISGALSLRQDDGSPLDVSVTPFADHLSRQYAARLQLLLAAVLVLLLIAGANVTVLMLTRSQERAAELALRSSLGASRGRLIRQLMTEALLLAILAAAGGLVIAMWGVDGLRALLPADIPRLADARIDMIEVGFALIIAAVTVVVAGLIPAMSGSATSLQMVLRESAAGGTRDRLKGAFVIAQVALAVTLTVAASLLARSAAALDAAPRGYDATGVFTTSITLPAGNYGGTASIASVVDRLLAEVSTIPGVTGATASSQLPFAGGSAGADVALENEAFTPGIDRQVRVRLISPNYFSTLGGRIGEGREFSAADGAGAGAVAIVNRTLASRLTPGGSPLGSDIKFNVPVFNGADGKRSWRVIGVTEDTWDRGPRERVEPEVLIPIAQTPAEVFFWISRELHVAARSTGSTQAVAGGVRRAITRIDPGIPMGAGLSLDERITRAFAGERLLAGVLSALGVAGALLALVGLGAIVHHQVRRRRREIAIRMALGASHAGVAIGFVRHGAVLALTGIAVGAAASVAVTPLLASLLFGVQARDPLTLGVVALASLTISSAAAWLPARHIASIDPGETLRG